MTEVCTIFGSCIWKPRFVCRSNVSTMTSCSKSGGKNSSDEPYSGMYLFHRESSHLHAGPELIGHDFLIGLALTAGALNVGFFFRTLTSGLAAGDGCFGFIINFIGCWRWSILSLCEVSLVAGASCWSFQRSHGFSTVSIVSFASSTAGLFQAYL